MVIQTCSWPLNVWHWRCDVIYMSSNGSHMKTYICIGIIHGIIIPNKHIVFHLIIQFDINWVTLYIRSNLYATLWFVHENVFVRDNSWQYLSRTNIYYVVWTYNQTLNGWRLALHVYVKYDDPYNIIDYINIDIYWYMLKIGLCSACINKVFALIWIISIVQLSTKLGSVKMKDALILRNKIEPYNSHGPEMLHFILTVLFRPICKMNMFIKIHVKQEDN